MASCWSGGYTAEIVIENRAAPVNGWTFTFSAPGVTVAQGWSGTWTDTGDAVRVTNAAWNASSLPGRYRVQRDLRRQQPAVQLADPQRRGVRVSQSSATR